MFPLQHMGAGGSGNAIAVAASQAIAATQQLTGRRTSRYLMKRQYINTRSSIAFHGLLNLLMVHGGSIYGSSQLRRLPQLPKKVMPDLKVVKIDSKMIISLD